MRWEELTAPEFERAVKETGVCLIGAGCLEKHFEHLPLGTDFLNGHRICCLAAEREPAVVFPPYYLGQVYGAKCDPGTITLSATLTVQVLIEICDEIARNGFRKIVIYNAHGGNSNLRGYLLDSLQGHRRNYAIYLPHRLHGETRQKQWKEILETTYGGHACEAETSVTLANYPELVKMDVLGGRKGEPQGGHDHLPPGRVSGFWYATAPQNYLGDATSASREKGEKLRELIVDSLVEYVAAVKRDEKVLDILSEFYDRCDEVGK